MSELEFMKYNNDLKQFFSSFQKSFPKSPNFKLNSYMKYITKDKKNVCSLKMNYNYSQGFELVPSIKFKDGDKLFLNLSEKMVTINTLINLNHKKFLKVRKF